MLGYDYNRNHINSSSVKKEYESIIDNVKENSTKVKKVKKRKSRYVLLAWIYLLKKLRKFNKK